MNNSMFPPAAAQNHDLHCVPSSVSESTASADEHTYAELLRTFEDLFVLNGASGLYHCGNARLRSQFYGVGKWKEGV